MGLSPGMRYQDLGADYYDKRAQASRKARYHLAELDALGYDVVLTPQSQRRRRGNLTTPSRLTYPAEH
jgi:hypothetical protein